jgi:hypothetical protein
MNPVPGRVFAASVSPITGSTGNYQAVFSLLTWKKPMTVPWHGFYQFIRGVKYLRKIIILWA